MNQTVLIVVISLFAGAFAAGCTWVGIDLAELLGARLAARREQKRLNAAEKAAEAAANARG